MTPTIKRAIDKIIGKISRLISVATVLQSTNDGAKMQFDDDDVQEDVPIITPYGFHSIPKPASKILVINNGDRNCCFGIGSYSETIHAQTSKEAGVVELLDGKGARLTLLSGNLRLDANRLIVKDAKEDLVELNKELISIIETLVSPGSAACNRVPVIFSPDLALKLAQLKEKWG